LFSSPPSPSRPRREYASTRPGIATQLGLSRIGMPRSTARSSPIVAILPSSTRITACSMTPLVAVSARPTRIASRPPEAAFEPGSARQARRRKLRFMFVPATYASEHLSVAGVVLDRAVDQDHFD